MPDILLFGQQDADGAPPVLRSVAQKFKPVASGQAAAVDINVRTSAFDGGGGRAKRAVVLSANRSVVLAASAWTTAPFIEPTDAAWNLFTLLSIVDIIAGESYWLGVEFELSNSTEDRFQPRSAQPPDAFTTGTVFGTDTPTSPRTIFSPTGSAARLTDPIDGVNLIDVTLSGNGDWAIRAWGTVGLGSAEGWGILTQ